MGDVVHVLIEAGLLGFCVWLVRLLVIREKDGGSPDSELIKAAQIQIKEAQGRCDREVARVREDGDRERDRLYAIIDMLQAERIQSPGSADPIPAPPPAQIGSPLELVQGNAEAFLNKRTMEHERLIQDLVQAHGFSREQAIDVLNGEDVDPPNQDQGLDAQVSEMLRERTGMV